ncbi:MAG: glycosyltransferase family 25 protein [Micropepsaceae bacterium]
MPQDFFAAFVNLDRVPGRRLFMERQFAAAGIEAERISAIDRNAPGFVPRGGLTVQREDVLIEINWDGRPYVTGEEACVQSHLAALKRFLATDKAFGVICEDDAELAPDFRAVVEAAITKADLWDAVRLESIRRKGGRVALDIAALTGPYRLVASLNPAAGSAAYLFSRAGAERLIAAWENFFEPYDNFLSALGRHKLRLLDVSPFPARQGLVESSRADKRHPPRPSLAAAFTRWQRHVRADLIGRHVRRWPAQFGGFPGRAHAFTLAPWSRTWPGPPQPEPVAS